MKDEETTMRFEIPLNEVTDMLKFPGQRELAIDMYGSFVQIAIPKGSICGEMPVYLLLNMINNEVPLQGSPAGKSIVRRFNDYYYSKGINVRLYQTWVGYDGLIVDGEEDYRVFNLQGRDFTYWLRDTGIEDSKRLEAITILRRIDRL